MISQNSDLHKPILFICSTYYQLMTAINIKRTLCIQQTADLLLTDTTDFNGIIDNIKKCNVFRDVYQCKVTEKMVQLSNMSVAERKKSTNPIEVYNHVGLPHDYTDLYMTFSRLSCTLYYYFIHMDTHLDVHLYEDGVTTYYLPISKRFETDGLDHGQYGERRLMNHIVENLMYATELYCAEKFSWPNVQLTKPQQSDGLKDVIFSIFDRESLPGERYVFLEEFHAGMLLGNLFSDFLIMEKVAEIVGKENIVIKRHPRCPVDRFTPAGYKVMDNQRFPWEIILFGENIDDKVLLTVSSTAVLTPLTLFDQKNKVICFSDLVLSDKANFWDEHFKQKVLKEYNAETKTICFPRSEQELSAYIHYFEGQQRLMTKTMHENAI